MNTIKEIIDFAVAREKDAAEFYARLAKKVKTRPARQLLEDFEQMEYGHATALMVISQESIEEFCSIEDSSPAITEFLKEPAINEEMSYQEIITAAMKREDVSNKLYLQLAENAKTDSLKKLFLKLAEEELKHKKMLETIYDDEFYKEN